MRGRLWQVSAEELCRATSEEGLGGALALELHRDLLKELRGGQGGLILGEGDSRDTKGNGKANGSYHGVKMR